MEYQVVEAGNPRDLERNVWYLILLGWVPLGGVEVIHYDGSPRGFYQAMTRQAANQKGQG